MKKIALLGMLVTAFTLVSCGGSSDQTNIIIPANLQTTLATPTYAPGSDELAAFTAINAFRNSMGLGYWQQNTALDQVAQNHMVYSIANDPTFQEDIEVVGRPGFTGTTPSQRAIHVGYFVLENTPTAINVPTAAVGELYATGAGNAIVDAMVNTIYLRSGLMAQSTRVMGLARDTSGVATPGTHWWFNHGRLDAGQAVASNYTAQYPRNGQLNVPLFMTPENPSVYANQPNFNYATQTSSPVSFTSAALTNLSVGSFTVTPAGSSVALPGTIWTIHNDPNLSSGREANSLTSTPAPTPTLSNFEAYWVGNAPFLPNTTYNVVFTGSTYLIPYGTTSAVTQSWSFTTGT